MGLERVIDLEGAILFEARVLSLGAHPIVACKGLILCVVNLVPLAHVSISFKVKVEIGDRVADDRILNWTDHFRLFCVVFLFNLIKKADTFIP